MPVFRIEKNENYTTMSNCHLKDPRLSLKAAKSILVSCGVRLAPFDIEELREITAYDELQLDTVGDSKRDAGERHACQTISYILLMRCNQLNMFGGIIVSEIISVRKMPIRKLFVIKKMLFLNYIS